MVSVYRILSYGSSIDGRSNAFCHAIFRRQIPCAILANNGKPTVLFYAMAKRYALLFEGMLHCAEIPRDKPWKSRGSQRVCLIATKMWTTLHIFLD